MPSRPTRVVTIEFPLGGLDRATAYQHQRPFTTPLAKNIWPIDPPSGRQRGGVRPVLKSLTTLPSGSTPHHWASVSWLDTAPTPDVVREGILVCTSTGTYTTYDGTNYTAIIATAPGSLTWPKQASCAYFNGYAYQATAGANTKQATILGASEANLSNAGGGTAPTQCGLVWVHQDRLALAGDFQAPHRIYLSAVGDATDWDYADPTVGGAWSNTGSEGGQLGHAVTAAINHNYDVSLVGSSRSIYALVGNPRVGGTHRVSHSVGPLTNNAWCKGIDAQGNNSTFLMTYDGLYMIPAGDFTQLVPLSRRKIPEELLGANPVSGDKVAIGYDSRWPGIHVSIDPNSGSDVNYFYHIPTDSWWPLDLPITPHLFPTLPQVQTDDRSAILPIGSAGSVRQYDNAEDPGGGNEEFDSYVWIGPIQLGSPGSEGVLVAISAALAKDSEDVNWEIYVGDTSEEAFNSSAAFTGTKWTYATGRYWNYTQHPRVAGKAFYIKLYDVSNERWLIEEIIAEIQQASKRRRVGT